MKKRVSKGNISAPKKKKSGRKTSPGTKKTAVSESGKTPSSQKTRKTSLGKISEKSVITREDIERQAYFNFISRGCQHGQDKNDWYKAEQTLKGRIKKKKKNKQV